jgi:hypothetical protein
MKTIYFYFRRWHLLLKVTLPLLKLSSMIAHLSRGTFGIATLLNIVERPGRGIALSGCKAFYERTSGARYYEFMRGHHDPDMFYRVCNVTPDAFDSLLHECRTAI